MLRMREEPGLGRKRSDVYGLCEGLWGHQRGKLWKKGELDQSWDSLDGELLDGVQPEGREQENPA